MTMWGLNKNKNKKSSVGRNLSDIGFDNTSTPLPSTVTREVKGFHEYNEEEMELYSDILNEMEPASRISMVERAVSLGIPTSFVVGYFDIDEYDAENIQLGKGEKVIVNNYIFNKKIMDKILIVTTSKEDVSRFSKIIKTDDIVVIDNVDKLIIEMENDFSEITLCITSNLPIDIEENIDLLISNLDGVQGINFVEIGTKGYFEQSLRYKSLDDIDTSNVRESDTTLEEIEEKLMGTSQIDTDDTTSEQIKTTKEEKSKGDYKSEPVEKNIKYDENSSKSDESLKIISKLEDELGYVKMLYAEKSNEVDDLRNKINSLENDLSEKDNIIHNDLNEKEKSLKSDLIKTKAELSDCEKETNSLKITIKNLEQDISKKRSTITNLEIDVTAQKELLKSKNKEINDLNEKLENSLNEKEKLEDELSDIISTQINPKDLEDLKERLLSKEVEIDNLNEQVTRLRIETRKEVEERTILKEDYEQLQESYKELLSSSDKTTKVLDELQLIDAKCHIFYFKVINQPPYFKSFMKNFIEIISEKERTLTIIIREEDDLSETYFNGITRIANLDKLNGEKLVWLKPSKLMFVKDEEFYNKYDNIIVIDYLKNSKRYIKGECVTPIHVFMNEKEKDLLGIKGLILSGGEQSIVDLRYDKKFELAKTPFIRKKYIQKKVSDWLNNMGLL